MFVKNLKLTNFRCYVENIFEFKEGINIIVGDNAVGKTSLVEGIEIIGITKSHRTSSDKEIVNINKHFYCLKATIIKNGSSDKVVVYYDQNGKKISKNDKQYKNSSDYLGDIKVVMFYPDDTRLVSGDPKNRRKFLDLNIAQLDSEYLINLNKYNSCLKERNELLKNFLKQPAEYVLLSEYDKLLITYGKKIIEARNNFINQLNGYFQNRVKIVSNGYDCGKLVYKPNQNVDNYENEYYAKRPHDIFNKTTQVGPHRDDFVIMLNEKTASNFASQGQRKTLALCLKLSLLDVFGINSYRAIVILDDVFGELDINRQNDLFRMLDRNNQIFITTTSIDYLNSDILKESNIINIRKEGENNG